MVFVAGVWNASWMDEMHPREIRCMVASKGLVFSFLLLREIDSELPLSTLKCAFLAAWSKAQKINPQPSNPILDQPMASLTSHNQGTNHTRQWKEVGKAIPFQQEGSFVIVSSAFEGASALQLTLLVNF